MIIIIKLLLSNTNIHIHSIFQFAFFLSLSIMYYDPVSCTIMYITNVYNATCKNINRLSFKLIITTNIGHLLVQVHSPYYRQMIFCRHLSCVYYHQTCSLHDSLQLRMYKIDYYNVHGHILIEVASISLVSNVSKNSLALDENSTVSCCISGSKEAWHHMYQFPLHQVLLDQLSMDPIVFDATHYQIMKHLPSTLSICTSDKPIGEGRCGDRVPSTPVRNPFNLGEKSERPSRAWLGLVNIEFDIVRQAWASGQRPGCRGTPLRSLNFVFIVPIMDSSNFSGFVLFSNKENNNNYYKLYCRIHSITYLNELIWALATDNCFKLSLISTISSIVSELFKTLQCYSSLQKTVCSMEHQAATTLDRLDCKLKSTRRCKVKFYQNPLKNIPFSLLLLIADRDESIGDLKITRDGVMNNEFINPICAYTSIKLDSSTDDYSTCNQKECFGPLHQLPLKNIFRTPTHAIGVLVVPCCTRTYSTIHDEKRRLVDITNIKIHPTQRFLIFDVSTLCIMTE
ncbi:hypothetical protein AGLY_000905 [Aphis glycines]|uniref:Uncharacterized protein n=1 Tax=Aphis glycines TaxID=307491 RepID=A0A6G0UAN1_APHGL|nr:hypothetical protein AGLY_000905 [Aphis glycines]